MTSQTEAAVDLTGVLAPVDQFAGEMLKSAERYGPTSTEFSAAQHVTWNSGSERIDVTVLITALQPSPGHFTLRVEFACNGWEVFHAVYKEYIINWVMSILSATSWESIQPEQKARVTWEEGFVFEVKRAD